MALRGRIDGVFDGVLRGWLWDPDRPAERLTAELRLDGASLGTLRADLPRADLEQAGFGDGGCGLEFALPIATQDGATHELALEVQQDGLPVTVDRLSLTIPRRLHMLRGRAERVLGGKCLGWAWDRARPDQPVLIELLHEERVLARQKADRPRPDLARLRIGDGRHGFAFDLATLQPLPPEGAMLELRCAADFGEWPLGRLVMPAAAPTALDAPVAAGHQAPGPAPAPLGSRRDYLTAARKAEGERDYAEAGRLLDAGLLLAPQDFDLLSIRARVHLAQQELEPAERLARRALERSPGHPRALLLLARITTALGRHEEAAGFWAGIGPDDSAFRERLVRRSRSLLAIGRLAEAMGEMALALRTRPDDPETLRHMAETAEAAGAPRAARAHWQRLLARLPEDRAAHERLATLERRLAAPGPQALASPLRNPDLRDWTGPIEAMTTREPARPVPGLTLASTDPDGRLRFAVVAPRQLRPGDPPSYGLSLRAEGGGAEAGFALGAAVWDGAGLRMALDLAAGPDSAGLPILLALRRLSPEGGPEGERILRHFRAEARPRLHRFDLRLTAVEQALLPSGGLELVVRLARPGAVLLYPPRALARLREMEPALAGGFEAASLEGALPPPASGTRRDGLVELDCPFTTIAIAAPDAALPATIQAVLGGTASPFECVLTTQPDWPTPLVAALRSLAALDPRFRLLPPDAPSAGGWIALVEAPPRDGPDWLVTLHEAAASAGGKAEAPGVMLEWCG